MASHEFKKGCTAVGGYGYAGNFTLYIQMSETPSSAANNYSDVSCHVFCRSNGSGSLNAKHRLRFELDGVVYRDEVVNVNVSSPNAFIEIGQKTVRLYHDDAGLRGTHVSAMIQASNYGLSASIDTNVGLTPIDRDVRVYHSVRSYNSNSISINWRTDKACNWIQYSLNDGPWRDVTTNVGTQTEGYYTLSGLNPATDYRINTSLRRADTGRWGRSGNLIQRTAVKPQAYIKLESVTVNQIKVSATSNASIVEELYRIKIDGGSYGSWQSSKTFNNLKPKTKYVVQVQLKTRHGEYSYASTSAITLDIARITKVADSWNIEKPTELQITNVGNCQMQLYLSYNNVEIVSRANISLVNGKYTLQLTREEINLIYKLSSGVTSSVFKFILKSYLASKVGEDSKTIKVIIPAKARVRPEGTDKWLRAIFWGKTTDGSTWKRNIIPWVDPKNNKNWVRI